MATKRYWLLSILFSAFLQIVVVAAYAQTVSKYTQAETLFTQGKTKDALTHINQLLVNEPHAYRAQFLKAKILTADKQSDAAIDLYEALIQQVPGQLESYNNLAMLYAAKGDLETARQLLEKAIKTQPAYATVYNNLSKIYVEMARDSYGKALKLDLPEQAIALASLNANVANNPDAHPAKNKTDQKAVIVASAKSQSNTRLEKSKVESKAVEHQPAVKQSVLDEIALSASAKNTQTKKNSTQVTRTSGLSQPDKIRTKQTQSKAIANTTKDHGKQVNKTNVINKDEIITTMQGWAAAWSAQQVDLYLSFYDEQYHPTGMSRSDWIEQRKLRVKRPKWVQITLNDFSVAPHQKDRAIVKLVQRYRSENYHDKTRKQFLLQNTPDGWRIMSELSLALLK